MKRRNCSIDVFRYVCAILVVMIHTNVLSEFNLNMSFICVQVLPRIAVPFFFAVAGYFYIPKLEQHIETHQYVKDLLKVYGIWSCLYFLVDFLTWGKTTLKGFIVHCIMSFFIYGSEYHFWFFPALIFSICIVTAMYRLGLKTIIIPVTVILYCIGVIGCAYGKVGINLPILGVLYRSAYFLLFRRIICMALPFFVSGGVVRCLLKKYKNIFHYSKYLVLAAIVVWLFEIIIVCKLGIYENIVLTFGLYWLVCSMLVWLLGDPFSQFGKYGMLCKALSNCTYYIHPFIIMLFGKIHPFLPTSLFVITIIVSAIISFGMYKSNNKYIKILLG